MVQKSTTATTVPPKVMHLPAWQCLALEEESRHLTDKTGVKVTQVQLVREALDEKFARMGVNRDDYVKRAANRSVTAQARRRRKKIV